MPVIFLLVCFSLVGVTLAQDFATAKFGLLVLGTALVVYGLFIWDRSLSRFAGFRKYSAILNGLGKNRKFMPFSPCLDGLAKVAQIALNGQIEIVPERLAEPEDFIDKRQADTLSIGHAHGEHHAASKVFPTEKGNNHQRRRQQQQNGKQEENERANNCI